MRIGKADTGSAVALVAEIGINHEGSLEMAMEMVGRADEAGADAVKIQTYVPELYAPWGDTRRLEMLRRFHLDRDPTRRLVHWAEKQGITVFSTPFDLNSVEFLLSLSSLVKIASGDITFFPLLERLAQSDVDLILSTGASSLEEVAEAMAILHRSGRPTERAIALLHCVSLYPASPETLNLRAITALQQAFPEATIGYSDHSLGPDAAVLACALGARIVEKHFTLDKDFSAFRDHALSATPRELADLRVRLDDTMLRIGEAKKYPHQAEARTRDVIRRSIVLSDDVVAGTILTRDQFQYLRPGTGISPRLYRNVEGRRTNRDLEAGTVLQWTDIT